MKKAFATIIVGFVLVACGSDSSVVPISGSSSHSTVGGGSGSSSSYAGSNVSGSNGATSTNGAPSGSVTTCGARACTSTEECCLMIGGGSNTFGCVPTGTCPTSAPPSDAGNPPPVDSGNPPPATCNGTADCAGGQLCCTGFGGGAPSCRTGGCGGRQQVCASVADCPPNNNCAAAGFGNNFMTCQPRPPADAGADGAADAGRDSGIRDASGG
jgi:hypothetical protein